MKIASVLLSTVLLTPSASGVQSRDQQIQEMLNRRAAAVQKGSVDDFLATTDSGSKEFQSKQINWVNSFKAIPIDGYSLKLDLDDFPNMARTADRTRLGGDAVVA